MEKATMRINIKDIKMLSDIDFLDKKKQKEENVLDNLHELIKTHDDYVKKENRFLNINDEKQAYRRQTKLNICKATGCALLGTILADAIVKGDVSVFEGLFVFAGSSTVGSLLFQEDTEKEYWYDKVEYYDAELEYELQNLKLEKQIASMLENIIDYIPYYKKETTWDSFSKEIFNNNENYIEKQIDLGNFDIEFDKERIDEILTYYFGDLKVLDNTIDFISTSLKTEEKIQNQVKKVRKK